MQATRSCTYVDWFLTWLVLCIAASNKHGARLQETSFRRQGVIQASASRVGRLSYIQLCPCACRTLPRTLYKQGSDSHRCPLPAGQSFLSINHVSVVKSNPASTKAQRQLKLQQSRSRLSSQGSAGLALCRLPALIISRLGQNQQRWPKPARCCAGGCCASSLYVIQRQHACNYPAHSAATHAAPSGTQQGHHPAAAAHAASTTRAQQHRQGILAASPAPSGCYASFMLRKRATHSCLLPGRSNSSAALHARRQRERSSTCRSQQQRAAAAGAAARLVAGLAALLHTRCSTPPQSILRLQAALLLTWQ